MCEIYFGAQIAVRHRLAVIDEFLNVQWNDNVHRLLLLTKSNFLRLGIFDSTIRGSLSLSSVLL